MYTYLRNICPLSSWTSLFKVSIFIKSFHDFFAFAYPSNNLWYWPLGKDGLIWYRHTSLPKKIYLKDHQFCFTFSVFCTRVIVEPALLCLLDCPSLIIPPSILSSFVYFEFSLRMMLCVFILRVWLFTRGCIYKKIFGISKPFPNTKTILTSVQSKLVMKRIQLIPMDRVSWELKFFVLFFGENIK